MKKDKWEIPFLFLIPHTSTAVPVKDSPSYGKWSSKWGPTNFRLPQKYHKACITRSQSLPQEFQCWNTTAPLMWFRTIGFFFFLKNDKQMWPTFHFLTRKLRMYEFSQDRIAYAPLLNCNPSKVWQNMTLLESLKHHKMSDFNLQIINKL